MLVRVRVHVGEAFNFELSPRIERHESQVVSRGFFENYSMCEAS